VTSLGYVLLYLGWGVGVAALAFGWSTRWRKRDPEAEARIGAVEERAWASRRRRGPWIVVAVLSCDTILTLNATWLRGPGPDGELVELNGWTGLDALSQVFVCTAAFSLIVFSVAMANGVREGSSLRAPAPTVAARARAVCAVVSICLVGVIGGNVLIQAAMPEGSRVGTGAWVACICSAVAATVCAYLWLQGSSTALTPLRSRP
jgi:hypothetical protein